MSSYYRQQLESWLSELDVKADTVFDVGGGQGNVKGRTKSWKVADYRVLDLPEFNLEEGQVYEDQADIVFCLEVFEYLIDPITAMENIENLLKDGGRAYITFAFAYPHHNELEFDSLRYTETAVHRLADSVLLTVQNIWYRHDVSGFLQKFYSTDGMHPAKQYQHHDVTGFIVELVK